MGNRRINIDLGYLPDMYVIAINTFQSNAAEKLLPHFIYEETKSHCLFTTVVHNKECGRPNSKILDINILTISRQAKT